MENPLRISREAFQKKIFPNSREPRLVINRVNKIL
jgi:hypothetical protein